MKAWTIIFCALVLVVINSFVSCDLSPLYTTPQQQTIYLSSEDLDRYRDKKDDKKDDKDDGLCSDRDSCQDICDDMFRSTSARRECYDLELDETSDLQNVFDAFASSSVTERKLEDIDAADLDAFLEISVDGFVDIILGNNREAKSSAYNSSEIQATLNWIGENSDVAESILDHDKDSDVLYTLFTNKEANSNPQHSLLDFISYRGSNSQVEWIRWARDELRFSPNTSFSIPPAVNEPLDDSPFPFLYGFLGINDNLSKTPMEKDILVLEYEDNDDAMELAHQAAVRFCEDVRGNDEDDVDQCLQALYCSIEEFVQDDEIFDTMEDHSGLKSVDCKHDKLNKESTFS